MATTTELFAEALHIAWMNWAKGLIEYVPQTKRDKWTKGMVPFAELPEEYKSQECDYARKVLTAMGMNETLEKAVAYDSLAHQLSEREKVIEDLRCSTFNYKGLSEKFERQLSESQKECNEEQKAHETIGTILAEFDVDGTSVGCARKAKDEVSRLTAEVERMTKERDFNKRLLDELREAIDEKASAGR